MARLMSKSKKRGTIKILSVTSFSGDAENRNVSLDFIAGKGSCNYRVILSYRDLYDLMMQCKGGEILESIKPEEWAQWMKLSEKALGKKEAE